MSLPDEPGHSNLELNPQAAAVCARFQHDWATGTDPQIEDYWEPVSGGSSEELLGQLIELDAGHRLKEGKPLTRDDYVARFPEHAELVARTLDEIQGQEISEISQELFDSPEPDPVPEVRPDGQSRQVGPYRVLEILGQGCMGPVYRAEQQEPVRRQVAWKQVTATVDTTEVAARFESQRDELTALQHPHLARVLDGGVTADGELYFVTELVPGLPITNYCDRQQLTIRERLQLFLQVCQAVECGHQKGLMHQHLRPSNVLVTQCDEGPAVRVADFGLAGILNPKAGVSDNPLFSQTAALPGTLEYVSPEQAEDQSSAADNRSDVYALGVLLYELLAGSTPLRHDTIRDGELSQLLAESNLPRPSRRVRESGEAKIAVAVQRGTRPRRLQARLRRELDSIAMKALQRDRDLRYQSVGALADDVQQWLRGGAVQACRLTIGDRLQDVVRRHRWLFAVGVLSVILLAAGVVNHSVRGLQEAQEAQIRAEWKAYSGQIAIAQHEWHDGAARAAHEVLEECQPNLRGWEHRYLRSLFSHSRNQRTLRGHRGAVTSVAFSPDGTRIVSGSADQSVKVWQVESGEESLSLEAQNGKVTGVAFSPDGSRIVSGTVDNTVRLWGSGGQERRVLEGHSGGVYCVAFSPDGAQMASGSHDGTIKLWDASSGRELKTLYRHDATVTGIAFSPDGRLMASGGVDHRVRVWDLQSGEEISSVDAHRGSVNGVAFSPDGSQIVSASHNGIVKLWDVASARQLLRMRGHRSAVTSVAFSPDGLSIVSGSYDRTVRLWDAETGQEIRTFQGHLSRVSSVAFNPDGTRIVSGSADRTVKVWDASHGQQGLLLQGHDGSVTTVALSSNSTRIASGSHDGTVKIWDVISGEERQTLKGHTHHVSGVAFSPDGDQLVSIAGDYGKPGEVLLWDLADGQIVRRFSGHQGYVTGVAFSPDGRQIVTSVGNHDQPGEIRILDVTDGRTIHELMGHSGGVTSVAFSHDGSQIVSGSRDSTIRIWDTKTGQETRLLSGHTDVVTSVAFSLDDSRIVSGSRDDLIKVWEAASGEATLSLQGHRRWVTSVAFSPDGSRIASGSQDYTVRVWDTSFGQETLTLDVDGDDVTSVAFSSDGLRIVAGSESGVIRMWDAATDR